MLARSTLAAYSSCFPKALLFVSNERTLSCFEILIRNEINLIKGKSLVFTEFGVDLILSFPFPNGDAISEGRMRHCFLVRRSRTCAEYLVATSVITG